MKLFSDDLPPVCRQKPEELFLVRIMAKPAPESAEAKEIGGAFVNCWVNADDLRSAEKMAIEQIQEEGWRPVRFDHWEVVCRESYTLSNEMDADERRDSLERVEEAFEYGIALAFYMWPVDAPDAGDETI